MAILAALRHPIRALDDWWFRVSPNRRLDRNMGNLCMLIGLIFPTFVIMVRGPAPSTALHAMPKWLQAWMCGFIFFGCLIKLHGVLSGTRWYFPHSTVKRCYSYGFIGAPIASSGLLVYGYFLISAVPNWIAAISATLTPMLGLGIGFQGIVYWLEWRRIDRNEEIMIRQAKTIVAAANDADAVD